MLIPLIGLITGVFVASIAGVLVLGYHPKWKLSVISMVLFIVGAFIGAMVAGVIYGKFFADQDGQLGSAIEVFGFFVILILGVFMGGKFVVWMGYKYFNKLLGSRNFP